MVSFEEISMVSDSKLLLLLLFTYNTDVVFVFLDFKVEFQVFMGNQLIYLNTVLDLE